MEVSQKAKKKLDEASKEIKESIDNVKKEVTELTKKVKEKLKGTGQDMRESADDLSKELKGLSEKIRELVPKKAKKSHLPVNVERYTGFEPDAWSRSFLDLRKATNRLFDDFYKNLRMPLMDEEAPWAFKTDIWESNWPRVDMSESDNDIVITAELPGVDKDSVDISVTDNRITISGEKREQQNLEERGYYKTERSYGSFQRSFYLPCKVESDKVDAHFTDGVLTVNLPKSMAESERIKKIPIRSD
jgi:HSP20 family protein